MKVFINKASNMRINQGGIIIVAANTAVEAQNLVEALMRNDPLNWDDLGYMYDPMKWEELPAVIADYDTPTLLAEDSTN